MPKLFADINKMAYAKFLPSKVRALISSGVLKLKSTVQHCEGYKQANIAILPQEFSDDFEKFCKQNPGPLPLLYRSRPGQLSAGPFAPWSNIKTELPGYVMYKNGKKVDEPKNLKKFDISNYCTFYLGCSYSFYHALSCAGIHPRNALQGKDAPMYVTNIDCHPAGIFKSKMVVSMIPVPKNKLSLCATITESKMQFHGPPIHYGNPADIGISALEIPDYGDVADVRDDEVPVFFGCGATGLQAITRATDIPVAFTDSPGMMFITDLHLSEDTEAAEETHVIAISESPGHFGVLSDSTKRKLNNIGRIISEEECDNLDNDFVAASLALSQEKSVLITITSPADSTGKDEILGIILLATALCKLDKKVCIIAEESLQEVLKGALRKLKNEEGKWFKVVTPHEITQDETDAFRVSLALEGSLSPNYKSFPSNARYLQRAENDGYINKFLQKSPTVGIDIRDARSELKIGITTIIPPNKNDIDGHVETDLLVEDAVGDMGAWGLLAGLYALTKCEVHQRYLRKGIGQSESSSPIDSMLKSGAYRAEIRDFLGLFDVYGKLSKDVNMDAQKVAAS